MPQRIAESRFSVLLRAFIPVENVTIASTD